MLIITARVDAAPSLSDACHEPSTCATASKSA